MKTKEEIKKEIYNLLNNYKTEVLDVKKTQWICEVFKKTSLVENEFTHSKILLVKDTDWHTDYDIVFYKDDIFIQQVPLDYCKTGRQVNPIDIYITKICN